jgi:pimeloyl-ACP methyl ester carboxylesterase
VKRRSFIGSGAAALGATAAQAAAGRDPVLPAMVLVHGAWHGGWCWQRVVPHLIAAGHAVYTPTLTGLGERSHLARPDIDLSLHARDVQAVIEMEDLRDVVLVGHSYAGFVISLLAERITDRLRKLVYLDAFVPEDGHCVLDYIQPAERRAALRDSGRETGYAAPVPLAALGVTKPDDLAWAQPRIVRQPFASFEQKLQLARPAGRGLARHYIACTRPASGSFGQFAAQVRNDPTWHFDELPSGHDAMIIDPQPLARLLTGIATQRG